jgi:hypothetical protein
MMTYRSRGGIRAQRSKACTAVLNDTDEGKVDVCVEGYSTIGGGGTFEIKTKFQGNLFPVLGGLNMVSLNAKHPAGERTWSCSFRHASAFRTSGPFTQVESTDGRHLYGKLVRILDIETSSRSTILTLREMKSVRMIENTVWIWLDRGNDVSFIGFGEKMLSLRNKVVDTLVACTMLWSRQLYMFRCKFEDRCNGNFGEIEGGAEDFGVHE